MGHSYIDLFDFQAVMRIYIWKAYPLVVTLAINYSKTDFLYSRKLPVRSEKLLPSAQLAIKLATRLVSFLFQAQPSTPAPSMYLVPVTMSAFVCLCFLNEQRCTESCWECIWGDEKDLHPL